MFCHFASLVGSRVQSFDIIFAYYKRDCSLFIFKNSGFFLARAYSYACTLLPNKIVSRIEHYFLFYEDMVDLQSNVAYYY